MEPDKNLRKRPEGEKERIMAFFLFFFFFHSGNTLTPISGAILSSFYSIPYKLRINFWTFDALSTETIFKSQSNTTLKTFWRAKRFNIYLFWIIIFRFDNGKKLKQKMKTRENFSFSKEFNIVNRNIWFELLKMNFKFKIPGIDFF